MKVLLSSSWIFHGNSSRKPEVDINVKRNHQQLKEKVRKQLVEAVLQWRMMLVLFGCNNRGLFPEYHRRWRHFSGDKWRFIRVTLVQQQGLVPRVLAVVHMLSPMGWCLGMGGSVLGVWGFCWSWINAWVSDIFSD
ncbi:hypothetical protein RHMOL_Rhmol11G0113000 [Rhododendron molle]|uniref:Uncharacterized protein n=1 Tax=Rhododendron molle TaxID=49168 RepID=A0ACC0LRZ9_RHOML|nr:hypothetical protein RHMOL_Rhmol11G0113000 [Rhododendron molle]